MPQLSQSELGALLGAGGMDLEGTVEVEVIAGGPVASCASISDSHTQEPVFVPASPV